MKKGGTGKLYDYAADSPKRGSEHASMLQEVIEDLYEAECQSWDIITTTVNEVVAGHSIARIDLLKIDVEGGEIKVLQGAKTTLEGEMVDYLHFEFNETTMVSRVFMKDFFRLLPNYEFYRMLPDGLVALGTYLPLTAEIFAYQNIVAIRQNVKSCL